MIGDNHSEKEDNNFDNVSEKSLLSKSENLDNSLDTINFDEIDEFEDKFKKFPYKIPVKLSINLSDKLKQEFEKYIKELNIW